MKIAAALLALTVAAPIAAAQGAGAPPANPMATAFRNRTTTLRRNILQALDSIPESKFNYKPTPAQLTIGYIAQHMAADDYFFCNNFSDKKATISDEESKTADSVKATWPKAKLMANLRAAVAFCDDAMSGLDDAGVAAIVSMPGPNNTTRQVPRVNSLIGHAIDLADHYSQLANYMRLNGILPPTALPRPGRSGQ